MSIKVDWKSVWYFIKVLPPVVDAIKGIFSGVKKGLDDVKSEKVAKKDAEQRAAFEEANRGSDDF